ncbi:DNA-O6-methylguanine--protein-cysteine S-methyltransferase /transcriptional regulator Ada [Rhodobacter aestuarii]|uniref:methylated-DNA--[protein]-cysteine S-methyltransferase n=1 Tax=Rhodobacter aestuarii TaxID=453582 RepID=A0A1N7JMZ2_9RHOB|nr:MULTISPECIES: methylated-DNA--[protein]-cysteine S-methyltransferase [Rhodobacter]PTV96065.1 DNA-O6-methylguanine--protein-cysteine S-methyltransferase /transcriptional regulator Ada [Rhodobacter aestuarii]SIS50680.1 DNA-O6-methylguanine--protein-cysteine S-methyltransferase /Transcriptional regulator Ada [Rhodobacter aestuarii]SOC09947.1 DNA-O6-methylguanine--protein-cysteine S-methyltransferase /transcriptional regulator Ada [Rhodobacter sp. JA431]
MPAPAPTNTSLEDSYHYRVIARAIAEIDAAQAEALAAGLPAQISLTDLAARLGFSAAHFQKLFTAWAGVSPKRYTQYLSLSLARDLLAGQLPLEQVAAAAGLSTASRLHDLILRWEAMTPGEFAAGAAGQVIRWGRFASPFGEALIFATERGICGLAFTAELGFDAAFIDMIRRWPGAELREDPVTLAPLATAALGGQGEVALSLIGAPFQLKVWEALLALPPGAVTTYSALASQINAPKAARAVGTAVGRNPIALLIPCHRVLRQSGGLGGYHWGLPVKRAILAREAARRDAQAPLSQTLAQK